MSPIALAITLVVGGATLVALGALRLVTNALGAMPRSVAVAIVVIGLGVGAFGAVLPRLPRDAMPEPTLTLHPETGEEEDIQLQTAIEGVVRTVEGEAVVGLDVALEVDAGSGEQRQTTTDDEGSFRFEEVPVPGPHRVVAVFDGHPFASSRLVVGPGPTEEVEVVVAPTTEEDEVVSIRAESIAVVGDEQGVQVVHALTVANDSEQAYVGGVPMTLLPGATAIQPGSAMVREEVELQTNGLVSRAPLLPGSTELTMTYFAQMPRDGLVLEHNVSFATGRFDLLTGEGLTTDPQTQGSTVADVELGDRTYRGRTWQDLSEGDVVGATILVDAGSGTARIVLIAIAVAAALAVVAFPLVRRRREREAPGEVPATVKDA